MVDNDRNHIRIKMHTRIFVEVLAGTDSADSLVLPCEVMDVSYGGFRVSIASELTVGSILSVCAELPAVQDPFYMAAEVKWCRPSESSTDRWLAGFQLLMSSDSDIHAWRALLEHV